MTQDRCNRVLLIEDNPADVFLVREAIRCRPIDCDLEVVETFEGAMDVVKSGSIPDIDAILIDLNLRTGSGLDVLNAVRSTDGLKKAPIAILTSSDSPRDRDAAMQLGADLFIRKPSDLDSFLNDVGSAIARLLGIAQRSAAAS